MEQVPRKIINKLEDLLVQEFRACQTLLNLTKDERQALARNDIQGVATLVDQKEAWLDELAQIEEQRRTIVQEIAGMLPLKTSMPTISDLVAALEPSAGNRINRLKDGISALSNEIRELTSGNRALAASALERTNAVQSLLVDIIRPSINYQPPGSPCLSEPGPAWGVDQRT